MVKKLIVVIMGPGKKHFAEMCLDSVRDADKILYWTSNFTNLIQELSTSKITTKKLVEFKPNEWDETDPATNGKCRQRYLEHLKENYPDDWCLCLDEDELIEDLSKIKDFIQLANPGLYNVKMRHFIGDLGHEDALTQVHVVPCRLFKISEAVKYPEHSHPILEGNFIGNCLVTTIWHLGHLPVEYMDYILRRYHQHSNDSIIHNKQFLEQWRDSHLFGHYPVREINPMELPKQIVDRYEINLDKFYFANRQNLEVKHFLMIDNWLRYFNPKSILDIGCGIGLFGYALKLLNENIIYKGIDKSKYAIELNKTLDLSIGDITKFPKIGIGSLRYEVYDLILCLDILEHLEYKDLESTLNCIKNYGEKFLFSIPFLGDPNLEADITHIIKEDKEWWKEKLSKYFKIKDAPSDWLFHEQLLIGTKKEEQK